MKNVFQLTNCREFDAGFFESVSRLVLGGPEDAGVLVPVVVGGGGVDDVRDEIST